MSFEHAPVSKGLMLTCALTSIAAGIFDKKHYLHLQLTPHISRHHQYWRLFAHHAAYSNSSELFLAELILYNIGVQIERQFGSIKFASFAVIATLVSTILEFIALLLFHRTGLNYIPSGPSALIFAIVYQYMRLVPSTYHFRIFGVPLSNKSFSYLLALQLAFSQPPSSVAVALFGIMTGQIYRSDLASFKAYRLPPAFVRFSRKFLLPLLGPSPIPRRSNRALPDRPARTSRSSEEPVTTAPAPQSQTPASAEPGGGGTSVMREWVSELTGRAQRIDVVLRTPPEAEIAEVASMFPDMERQAVVGALQRSPNAEAAVEMLLRRQ